MFDYDRLSLDVKEQFAKSTTPPAANAKDTKDTLSNGSSESQLFGWESPSPPATKGEDDENAIVHGLSELLRRCSSPGHHFSGQYLPQQFGQPRNSPGNGHFQRHRSATISNGGGANEQQMLYSQTMISPNLHHQYQQQQYGTVQQQRHRTIGNALSMDLNDQQQPNRRFSGGSMNFSEIFDCGASSGYGSPGAVGTPLASPAAAATAQYIAHQLQKMFDQGYCEPNGGAGTGMSPPMPMMGPMGGATPIKTNGSCKGIAANVPPQSGLSTPSAIPMAIPPGATPVLVKATTTTTGTNKNSNKRKTSIANVVANGNNGGSGGGMPGGQQANGMMGMAATAPENIVATEDGFDTSEIAEFAELLTSPKRQPPSRYLCHICYQPGHYISDCPQRFNSPYEELTPYQGRKKCYGEFQCEQCKRKWTSQNSVANEAQSCIKCHVPVFPHKQLPVDKAIALGLVKLQRLPVPASPTTPPTPVPGSMLNGGGGPLAAAAASQKSQPQILTAAQSQAVRNMVEDAANIYLGLKNGSLTTNSAANAAAMTQLAI